MYLKIQTTQEISVPKGTKVITNDKFLTLARKSNGNLKLYTCPIEDVNTLDLNVEDNWMEFTRAELNKILEM